MPMPAMSSSPPKDSAPETRRRRKFTAAEKLRIVEAAAACAEGLGFGTVSALLRREGIYSSQLAEWRGALRRKGTEGLDEQKPGRKPSEDARVAELERQLSRLRSKLDIAEKVIALQKKASEMLGIALESESSD